MNINECVADSLVKCDPFIVFSEQLKDAMTQYRKKHGISVSEHSARVEVPSHVILAVERGILQVEDLPIKHLIQLYRLHEDDMPKCKMTFNITYR